jgi:hypothetical protein
MRVTRRRAIAGFDAAAVSAAAAGAGARDLPLRTRYDEVTGRLRAAFAARLAHPPAGEFVAGCRDDDFWRRMLPAQVRFLDRHLWQRREAGTVPNNRGQSPTGTFPKRGQSPIAKRQGRTSGL